MYLEYFGWAFYIYWLIILFGHVWIGINIFYSFEDYESVLTLCQCFLLLLLTLKMLRERFFKDTIEFGTI